MMDIQHQSPVADNHFDGDASPENWDADFGSKQPNFLQKLYNFLSLDPHPCPEVIYWASDSRQLVIAQPDRLVKEVLPKLFKHDKLASFGRQLNIYGFSRLFPGRQFKDANGNVSDASVWAHPTLHRASSTAEVNGIKRRAAPKLFRTRRLANGQIVRTRAGPAVEAKAREVRESIAETRRNRSSISGPVRADLSFGSPVPSTPSLTFFDPSPMTATPAPPITPLHPITPQSPRMNFSIGRRTPLRASLTYSDTPRLADIHEGVVASHNSGIPALQPLAPSYEAIPYDTGVRRDSVMSIDPSPILLNHIKTDTVNMGSSGLSPAEKHLKFLQSAQVHLHTTHDGPSPNPITNPSSGDIDMSLTSTVQQTNRAFQSCPASIHTTPVPAHMTLNPVAWFNMFVSHNPFQHVSQISPTQHIPQQTTFDQQYAMEHTKIASPAAVNPFMGMSIFPQQPPQLSIQTSPHQIYGDQTPSGIMGGSSYPLSPSTGDNTAVQTFANTPITSTPGFANSVESAVNQIQASWSTNATGGPSLIQQSLQSDGTYGRMSICQTGPGSFGGMGHVGPLSPPGTGTIDPRWVSPRSSTWGSAAPTRAPSPSQAGPQTMLQPSSMNRNDPPGSDGNGVIPLQTHSLSHLHMSHDHDRHESGIQPPQGQGQQVPFLPQAVNQTQTQVYLPSQVPVYGTQSYPPGGAEKKHMNTSPPLPLFTDAEHLTEYSSFVRPINGAEEMANHQIGVQQQQQHLAQWQDQEQEQAVEGMGTQFGADQPLVPIHHTDQGVTIGGGRWFQ